MDGRTYRTSTWNYEKDDWRLERTGLSKWKLKKELRRLYSDGWDTCTILIESEQDCLAAADAAG